MQLSFLEDMIIESVLLRCSSSVLERGEKIDSLVQKSDGLSSQSKMFYTQVW